MFRALLVKRFSPSCKKKIDSRTPVLISSAASGLVARMLEEAGADCVNTFHGARLRANGMGTMAMLWPIVNANEQVFKNTQEDVLPAMKGDAFVCMCINANDPLRDMWGFLEQIKSIGVMSVSNIGPSVSYIDRDSEIFKVLRKCGITIENEIEMLKLAKEELGMVTIGVAFTEEDSLQMIEQARPDIFCYHAGTTKGGRKGYDSGETIEDTAARTKVVHDKVQEDHAGADPHRPRRRDGNARGGPVHARPRGVRRHLDRLARPNGCRSRKRSLKPARSSPRCGTRSNSKIRQDYRIVSGSTG